jgi:uncharacterized damage-inducible protein DinB
MQRFTGEGSAPNRLDAILFESFDEFRAAREAEDRRIVAYVDGWMTRASPAPSNTAASHRQRKSSSSWRRRWPIGSITRLTTAARYMRC